MKFFPNSFRKSLNGAVLRVLALGSLALALVGTSSAQYNYPQQVYPPGYYPQYPRGYGQQPTPPRRDHPRHRTQPSSKAEKTQPEKAEKSAPVRKSRDISTDAPPAADFAAIASGPLTVYTWDDRDSLSDLAKAAGISNSQLLALNGLSVSQLRSGQVLKVPPLAETTKSLDIARDEKSQMAREVWRGVRGKKRVALTFDSGGVPDSVDVLLENLTSAKVPATFFSTGEFVKKYPKAISSIKEAGYSIYNHSCSHPEFTNLSDDEIRDQLERAEDAISSATGQSTKPFFRPPFGDRNARVLRVCAEAGYRSIYWTHDSLDSVGDKKSADFVADRVLNPPKSRGNPDHFLDGAIILMHVGEAGSAAAIPEIVKGLRARGFTFVTIDEILKP